MKRIVLFVCFLFLLLLPMVGQRLDTIPRPRLIVCIAVDGLRSDYLSLFWNDLDVYGFRRLIRDGCYSKSLSYPFMAVGNAADYASVVTGTTPSEHGICGERYWDKNSRQERSFVYDPDRAGVNTGLMVSPRNILATTFADELKLNTQGRAKVITVALNAEEAVVMSGHGGDATVWVDDVTGKWASSAYYSPVLPGFAAKMNGDNVVEGLQQKVWSNLYLDSYYMAKSQQSLSSAHFSYAIGDVRDRNGSWKRFKETPYVNGLVREAAIEAIRSEYVGIDEVPDLINLQFTVKVFNQGNTGVLTSEMQDVYFRLDKELRVLTDSIDALCGKGTTLYVLYGSQTEFISPDYLRSYNMPSGYFVADQAMSLLSTYLMSLYGQAEFIQGYDNRQIFLNHEAILAKGLDYDEVERKVADFMVRFQGVQYAFRGEDMLSSAYQNERIRQAQSVYNKDKSGDILLVLKPGWAAVNKETERTGVSSRVNNYVPFALSGWRVKSRSLPAGFSALDIAPTLCNLLYIAYPNASMGRALTNIIE